MSTRHIVRPSPAAVLHFDGSTQHVKGEATTLAGNTAFSIRAIVYPTADRGTGLVHTIYRGGAFATGNDTIVMLLLDVAGVLKFAGGHGTSYSVSTATAKIGQWQEFVMVREASAATVTHYVDGKAAGGGSFAGSAIAVGDTYLGKMNAAGWHQYAGRMALVEEWGRALTAKEVADLAVGKSVSTTSLLRRWGCSAVSGGKTREEIGVTDDTCDATAVTDHLPWGLRSAV